jgi:hypothetical protein
VRTSDCIRSRETTHHKYTPTLSACAVARKSLDGENEMLVATLLVRNASMRSPLGISKVRMMESKEDATSQRESGENVCGDALVRFDIR